MTVLLIDLVQMLDGLSDEVSGRVRLGLSEIAKRLTGFDEEHTYRLTWLDDGDFTAVLPYLEVMRK
ncbi:MAG: hypothetical protein V3W44_02190 [Dehalococcoidales bacterium]